MAKNRQAPITYTIKKVFRFSDIEQDEKYAKFYKEKAQIKKMISSKIIDKGTAALRTATDYIMQPIVLLQGYNIFLDRFRPPRRDHYGSPVPPRLNYDTKDWNAEVAKEKAAHIPGIRLMSSSVYPTPTEIKRENLLVRVYTTHLYDIGTIEERVTKTRLIKLLPDIWFIVHPRYLTKISQVRDIYFASNFYYLPWEEQVLLHDEHDDELERRRQIRKDIPPDVFLGHRRALLMPQHLYPCQVLVRRPLLPLRHSRLIKVTKERKQGKLVELKHVFPHCATMHYAKEVNFYRKKFPLLVTHEYHMTPAEYHKKRGIQPRFACDWAERAKTLRKTLETQRQLLQEVKRDYERCGELKEFRTELDDPVFNPLDYEWNQELYGDEKQEVSGAEEKQAAYGGT